MSPAAGPGTIRGMAAHFKKPAPGQDLSQGDLAAALEDDEKAPLRGELDLGLDDDPDLRTRPGQASLLRPKRKSRAVSTVAVLIVVALVAAGAWIAGALERIGGPPPPRAVQDLIGSSPTAAAADSAPAPVPSPVKPKAKVPAGRRTRSQSSR